MDLQAPARQLPLTRTCPFDPPEEYRQLQAEEPISPLAFPDGVTGWLVTRYADVRALLADPRFSSRRRAGLNPVRRVPPELEDSLEAQPGMFIGMDPPDHTRYRRLLTGQFTVRRMNALTPRVAEIVADRLDEMATAGPPVDLVRSFALPVPSLVICELLGVPYADRARFQQWSAAMLSLATGWKEMMAARDELRAYMLGLVRGKRELPADDLLSGLLRRPDDDALTDEELVNIGVLLLIAGHETTANMLALGTLTLLRHPGQLALLHADPALFDGAVEELLRYLSIVQFGIPRIATEDVELGGTTIRAGDRLIASVMAADRDPAQFTAADTLDVTRAYSPHLGFGHGVHQCLGQQLARVEMRTGLRALLERFPTLRLAVPLDRVRMRDDMFIYGVHELPVTWDS
jgi:cytochrome P450